MSHEIRTPLNGIVGLTHILLNSNPTKEQKEYLRLMSSATDSLLGVINDILDFSKIESGKLELDNYCFNFKESLDHLLKALAINAYSKGLKLEIQVDHTIPDRLLGDEARLHQIIINLVGNAIKFTNKGIVYVGVKVEKITSVDVDLSFTIKDTGIGISNEMKDKIFKAFSQADSSTTRKYGGTGLGLAISARLVEMMKGKLWFESEIGQGSTFFFTVNFNLPSSEMCKSQSKKKNQP